MKVIKAEPLAKLIYDTVLSPEQKLLIMALALQDGEPLPLTGMPKSTGMATFEFARRGLNRKKIAGSVFEGNRRMAVLLDGPYKELEPFEAKKTKAKKNVTSTPPPEPPRPVDPPADDPDPEAVGGGDSGEPEGSGDAG